MHEDAALTRVVKVSSVLPPRGSTAGGTHIVLLGSGFRDPSGPDPFGCSSSLYAAPVCLEGNCAGSAEIHAELMWICVHACLLPSEAFNQTHACTDVALVALVNPLTTGISWAGQEAQSRIAKWYFSGKIGEAA